MQISNKYTLTDSLIYRFNGAMMALEPIFLE